MDTHRVNFNSRCVNRLAARILVALADMNPDSSISSDWTLLSHKAPHSPAVLAVGESQPGNAWCCKWGDASDKMTEEQDSMRFNNGWIKIHRSMIDGDIGSNGACLAIAVTLLGWATRYPTIIRWNGKPREIPAGSVLFGISELAEKTQFGRTTVYRHLQYLRERNTIEIETGTRGSLVTFRNWDRYQVSTESVERERNTDGTPEERERYNERNASDTLIGELRIKNKEYIADFESAYAEYKTLPGVVKGSKAESRFRDQIKTEDLFACLITAIKNYKAFLSLPDNSWRRPKTSFETFLGSKSSGFFWKDFINQQIPQRPQEKILTLEEVKELA